MSTNAFSYAAADAEPRPRITVQDAPSVTRSIADAVVLKEGDIFFLTERDGNVPLSEDHGFGLYYHDCRFLNGYELRLAGTAPDTLVSTAAQGFMAVSQLTTADLLLSNGLVIPKEALGIKWERVIDTDQRALHDVLTLQNFGVDPIEFPLSLTFRAEFEDVFAVRGMPPKQKGTLHEPRWEAGVLDFAYDGVDGVCRSLGIYFTPTPDTVEKTSAEFHVALQPGARRQVLISLVLGESTSTDEVVPPLRHSPDLERVEMFLQRSAEEWLAHETQVRSNSLALNHVIDRSLRDLRVLRSRIDDQEYFAAGVPWFATLFGRDSLITALQTLAFDPVIAEQTLRVLARYQGQREDPWKDEQPGKILHELRVGEMARSGAIPHTPYYGTVDATSLFLILVGQHAAWTGRLDVFNDLRDNVERALDWMARYGDSDGDGYIEYECRSEGGLANQGWKDAGDAIVNADGSLATPPIALVEVQGYAYLAKNTIAELFARAGELQRAEQLRREAEELRERFNRDFWLEEQGFYALALQANRTPAAVMTSNPGQALWSGIVDPEKAERTVERLMADDMFSGWGIRTFSSQERRYNPISYQLGSIWPHDNALIAAGLRRYGYGEAACRVFGGLVQAALHFPDYRLPELFTGFAREDFGIPVPYPVACRPQAWAAGAVPYLVESLLGLQPRAFERTLHIVRPILPEFMQDIELHGLRVGDARVDLRFERTTRGLVGVDVLKLDGELTVVLELA